jgi:hypothetical protein
MIFELSFALVGGINLGLERSWKMVEELLKKYPGAVWKKRIDWKRSEGKYIVKVD